MNNYPFKVSKLAQLVSSNLRKFFFRHEMEEFQDMILEMGLKHIDAFGFLSFYNNPEDHSKINDEYFRDQENLILQKNVSYSLFFFYLENYLKQFQKQDIEIINGKLHLVSKAYKIFTITILEFFDEYGLPEESRIAFVKNIQQGLTNMRLVHSEANNIEDINYIKKIVSERFGTDEEDTDLDKRQNQSRHPDLKRKNLIELLVARKCIPDSLKSDFLLLLKHKGRVDMSIDWNYSDWELYFLISFFEYAELIDLLEKQNKIDYIMLNFYYKSKKFDKKTFQANIGRAEKLFKSETRYKDYHNKLKDIFSSFELI